jgi:hypothetical protein
MFCGETPKRAKLSRKAAASGARAARSSAVISSVGSCPAQRSAKGSPACDGTGGASVTTGPSGEVRTRLFAPNQKRCRMVVSLSSSAEGGKRDTSNRSEEAARRFVPPQATSGLRPRPMMGRPGTIIPAAWKDGERIPMTSQRLGSDRPRCGSEASSGAPDALREGATATALLPLRDTPERMVPSAARRRSPPLPGSAKPAPASRVRCHRSGKPGRPRSASKEKRESQLMSVPASRPIASMSPAV